MKELIPATIATLVLSACSSIGPTTPRSVTIERTPHGIPHITAPSWYGIAYGVAYANAQDNVCQTAQQLVTVRGERSHFFGPQAMGVLGLRPFPNQLIDLFVRHHMDDVALERARAGMSADAREATSGYMAGYNRFLADTGSGNLPAECRNQAWVRPMTAGDLARVTEASALLAGTAAFADGVVGAVPPGKVSLVDDSGLLGAEPMPQVLASNGWAFGKNATPDGSGVLMGNPHFPWIGTNRFWQAHLIIPGQLDVMGAVIGNSPVVQVGFNRDVAWTHTVSTGRRYTLYELTLDPADPTTYLVDGQKKKMEQRTVTVPAAGGAAAITHTFYRTQWGPLVVVPRVGLTWSTSTAYAIADANTLNTRALDSWIRMNKARSVQELRDAMGNNGIPWVNTIGADRAGNALYADLSVVPDVSAAMLQRCAPSPRVAGLLGSAGIPVLNGSVSSCAWNRDAAAAQAGLTPAARMPVVVTPDWVQNSNGSFWLSNPAIKPSSEISPLVGRVGTQQNLRTRSAILEIQQRLAGTDGLPGNKMGVDEVRSVIFRNKNLAADLVLPNLLSLCERDPMVPHNAAQRDGCAALAKWDRTNNVGSKGAPLFREFWRKAAGVPNVWRVPFNAADPVNTPNGLAVENEAVRAAVLKALEDAVGVVRAAGYSLDVALGDVQFRTVRGVRVPIHGGDEFEGVLNKMESRGQPVLSAGGYRVDYGSSYMQAVTFDARGPVAYGLLTYGQGSSAESPLAFDQLELFSRKEWVKLPFHREEVERQRVGAAVVLSY